MRRTGSRSWAVTLLCVLAALTGCDLLFPPAYTVGIASDASDDSAGVPDLVSASVYVHGGQATVRVWFAPATFSEQTTLAVVSLDVDQDPATGHPGSDAGGVNDQGIIGSEYLVYMGSAYNGYEAKVFVHEGPVNSFSEVGWVPVAFHPDGLEATVPLAMLGSDDGRMNFKVTCSTQVSETGYTGVLDYLTDVGQPPGVADSP